MKYTNQYNQAAIKISKQEEVKLICKRITEGEEMYQKIADILDNGIHWWFIGIVHFMEVGHKYPNHFNYHLHCGDPLTGRTVHVPSGRPVADPKSGKGKPYTWEESALDALKYMKYDKVTDWSIENCLILFERYNGLGYKKRGVPSPYLWSYTTEYVKGKYVADGRYDPDAVSKQPGVAALMKGLDVENIS